MANVFIVLLTIAVLGDYVCSAQECPSNSSRVPCGSACEPTCMFPTLTCLIDMSVANCTMDCRCMGGFVRNHVTNECVELKDCPKTERCPSNSRRTLCGSVCEPTCEFPELACKIDSKNCTMDCRCRDGFVRNHVTNECVVVEDCPGSDTITAAKLIPI